MVRRRSEAVKPEGHDELNAGLDRDYNAALRSAKTVIIMRGIPGAGKSTYVREHFPDALVCSADDYHMQWQGGKDGKWVYVFGSNGDLSSYDFARKLFQTTPAEVIKPKPLLDGTDVMQIFGIGPGPLVGQILAYVKNEQLEGRVLTGEQALAAARYRFEAGQELPF